MFKVNTLQKFFNSSVSFIGCGKMGGAILGGLLNSGKLTLNDISIHEKDDNFGAKNQSLEEAFIKRKYILLAVKPKSVFSTLSQIQPYFDHKNHVLVSIVAGFPTKTFEEVLPNSKVIRVMPNTPSLVNEGASAICKGSKIQLEEMMNVKNLMQSVGIVQQIDQSLMDAATGISGCGVAFVLTFIEAMQNAGVREGLPRVLARKLAIQTALGSSTLINDIANNNGIQNVYPAILRGDVQSPGGATIAGSLALQAGGFQGAIYSAVSQATKRSKQLGMTKRS